MEQKEKMPIVRHPSIVWKDTQDTLFKIEKKLGGKVVHYYTSGSIVGDDVKYFYYHLKNIGRQKKLYFILNSGGGDGKSSYRIASLLREYCDNLVIILPEKAASAATMLSLAADQIIMTPMSYLTAVDTSLVHPLNPKNRIGDPVSVEIEEVKKVIDLLTAGKKGAAMYSEAYLSVLNYIHPIALGAIERTTKLSEMLCMDILSLRNKKINSKDSAKLIGKLNRGYPAHGYPITRDSAKNLGLPVVNSDSELDELLWKLTNLSIKVTSSVRSDLSDSSYLLEKYETFIESLGGRSAVLTTRENRMDSSGKGWFNVRDNYKWMFLSEKNVNGKNELTVEQM